MNTAFCRSKALLGNEVMEKISSVKVLIVGVGGVGSWCAEALARTGYADMTLADFDYVELSNINRQAQALINTVGSHKTEALLTRLKRINPEGRFESICRRFSADTADSFKLGEYDFVVDAIDSVADKAQLILSVLENSRAKLFSSMGAALRFDPSRVKSSAFKKVAGDGLARALRQHFKKTGFFPPRDFTCVWSDESPCKCGIRASLMPVTAAFGLKLASLIIDASRN